MSRPYYHNTDAAFMAEIRRDPIDDTVRLAFADHCDETDRPERAAFVRAQIELHGKTVVWEVPLNGAFMRYMRVNTLTPSDDERAVYTAHFDSALTPSLSRGDYLRFAGEPYNCGREIGAVRINEHQREIEFDVSVELPSNIICAYRANELREIASRNYRMCYQSWFWDEDGSDSLSLKLQGSWVDDRVQRGFLAHANFTASDFIRPGMAKGLFSAHPITSVRLVDRYPLAPTGESPWPKSHIWRMWSRFGLDHDGDAVNRHDLPPILFRATDTKGRGIAIFDTCDAALAALSDWCVDYGREQAKLPPLVRSEE